MGKSERDKWIVEDDPTWCGGAVCKCSACGYGFAMGAYFEPDLWRFCPMCGAKMEVDANREQQR